MRKVPVRIRGVDYPSIRAAARALDIPSASICYALDRGALEHVGLTRSRDKETISVVVPRSHTDAARKAIMKALMEMGLEP